MVYIGIDPGISPAICALDEKGILLWMKDIVAIKVGDKNEMNGTAIREALIGADHVFIEKAQAMPAERFDKISGKVVRQGISSTAHYMKSAGIIEGICIGLQIPYDLISPVSWKSKMMAGMQKGKDASLLKVQQLYPGSVKLKKDNHKAEALLICLYGIYYRLLRG
jgi:crossover junction endodeoxyribonuclease RuvC